MHKEALIHMIKKEQLILAFPEEKSAFITMLINEFKESVLISCPLPADELMGRIIAAWEEGKVAVVDLGTMEAPAILKNFLSDMLLYKKSTPYPYGHEYYLEDHKLLVLADKKLHNELREYFQVVHE